MKVNRECFQRTTTVFRGRESNETFEICDVYCEGETEKAIFVTWGDGENHWIPKSVVHDDSEVWKEGQEGDLVVKLWFAEKKGWV